MTNTLLDPPVASVLQRLFGAADGDDARFDSILSERPDLREADWDERGRWFDDLVIPVSPEGGRLLYSLVRAVKPATVVEYGMSFGISTLHLAAAVRDNGAGRVITSELSAAKVDRARRHFVQAGLADLITILEGDARRTLATVDEPIDLVLLDGWPTMCLDVLQVLEPKLAPGALVIADDTDQFAAELRGYLEHVRNPANAYTSVPFPIADGMELSCRT